MKKGQAAMEFLMTYGWALLIVLVAIAVLAAFGVFSGGKRGYEVCLMGPGLSCKEFKVQKAASPLEGIIEMQVTNGFGKDFRLFLVTIDPNGKTCQGMTGYAALNIPPSGQVVAFRDGGTNNVQNLNAAGPSGNVGVGIPCNNGGPGDDQQCCGVVNLYLPATATPLRVPCHVSGVSPCNPSLLPNIGSRFNEKLYISYMFLDSSLTHSRVGSLMGSVETG